MTTRLDIPGTFPKIPRKVRPFIPCQTRKPMTPENLPIEQYDDQLAEKTARLTAMMSPFNAPQPDVFRSPVSHYRMRAEFRVWHDEGDLYHIMFDQQTKARVRVDQFPAGSELINRLMPVLIAAVKQDPALRRKIFQIDYLSTRSGKIIASLLYHRKLDEEWQQAATLLRDQLRADGFDIQLIGRAAKTKIMLDQDYIDEVLPVAGRDMIYRQVENSFTQPNAEMNIQMLEWALNGVREFRRLQNVDLSGYECNTIFVDPPRSGLDDETVKMVQGYDRILYISCNPETLCANLETLSQTHRVTRLALFDQFPYTHHMESGVLLEKI